MDVPGGLRSLEVVLTGSCNLRCSYCYQERHSRRMEWRTLRAAVDLLLRSPRPGTTLSFYGGEPLLEFDLMRRAVEHARASAPPGRAIRFEVFTNGLLLDREKAAFLAEHRVRTQISHDGLPPAQDLRGRGTFARLDEVLDLLRREQPEHWCRLVEVATTLTGANLRVLADSVDYFLRKGVRTIRLAPRLTPDPDWGPGSVVELARQLGRVYRASLVLWRLSGEVPFAPFRRARGRAAPQRLEGWMCAAPRGDALTVDVDGRVTGCVLLARSYQAPGRLDGLPERLGLGHVDRLDLAGRLPAYRRLLRRHGAFHGKGRMRSGYGPCASCRFRGDCFVCPASLPLAGAGARDVPDLLCAFNQVTASYRRAFLAATAQPPSSSSSSSHSRPTASATSGLSPSRSSIRDASMPHSR